MASLVPTIQIGIVVVIAAIPSTLQTLALLALVKHWRGERIIYRGAVLFLGSALIYGSEFAIGIQLWASSSNTGFLTGLLELLLGAYAIGLGRAWELLGAPRFGFVPTLAALLRRARQSKPPAPKS